MQKGLKIKVCGMKEVQNIQTIAQLSPDYLGFIFFKKSARDVSEIEPVSIPSSIKKTGVFVNASLGYIKEQIAKHKLKAIQLHGDESTEFCEALKQLNVEVLKVFLIDESFNWQTLAPYSGKVDAFLFDTKKGEAKGGTGAKFDWNILEQYHLEVPFILSGGIDLKDLDHLPQHPKMIGIDINSKFEISPAFKDVEKVKQAIHKTKKL